MFISVLVCSNISGNKPHVNVDAISKYSKNHKKSGEYFYTIAEELMSGNTGPIITRAVRKLLRPLIALLMDHGLSYSWFIKTVKILYVDVAIHDFKLNDKELTDSRVCLLTGIDRKDIRKLRTNETEKYSAPENTSIGAELALIWMTEQQYLDQQGNPAPLQRLKSSNENSNLPSFEELFTSVTKSIKPRAFLDEWIRIGAVNIDNRDRVCINLENFVANKGYEEKVFFLGKNIHDHIASTRANVNSDESPFLERAVYYDQLSAESVNTLSLLSKELGMEFLREMNKKARALQLKDKKSNTSKKRMHVGLYFYSDRDDHENSK